MTSADASSGVSIALDDPTADDGAVLGCVEVLDDTLFVVARAVLRSGRPTPVGLATGWHTASACLASGANASAIFAVAQAVPQQLVRLRVEEPSTDSSDVGEPGTWLVAWRYDGTRWSATPGLTVAPRTETTLDIRHPGPDAPSRMAVQIGEAEGCASIVTVVPTGVDVHLRRSGPASRHRWSVTPSPGAAGTLLALLSSGDLTEARVVGEWAVDDVDGPGSMGGELLDIAIGYYLLRIGDSRLREWVTGVLWHQPDSADAAILNTWCELVSNRPDLGTARLELLRALSIGLPVVAAGLGLLGGALRHLAPDSRTTAAAAALEPYLHAAERSVLTTFAGNGPAGPGEPTASPDPSLALWLDGVLVSHDGLDRPPEVPAPNPGESKRQRPRTSEALRQLAQTDFGPAEGRYHATDPSRSLAVEVTVSDATTEVGHAHLNLEVRLEADGQPPHDLAGETLALEAAHNLYFLAEIDWDGRAAFQRVPATGSWQLTGRGKPAGRGSATHAFALPSAFIGRLAAAGQDDRNVLWRTTIRPDPQWPVKLVLRQPSEQEHVLEFSARVQGSPIVLAVAYANQELPRLVLVPLAPQPERPSTAAVVLHDLTAETPWTLLVGMEKTLNGLPLQDIATSIRAARSTETRAAWHAICLLPISQPIRDVIEDALRDEP